MNYNIIAYSVYIPVTIGLSIWIAKSLHKNTKAFLMEKFRSKEDLAASTNNLIQTGFYLIALGFSFMRMHIDYFAHSMAGKMFMQKLLSPQETIEKLAYKLGAFTLMLGFLLFTNFFIMLIIQKPKERIAGVDYNQI
jgi:uncharacterized membrane protein YccF (DUF307 family)